MPLKKLTLKPGVNRENTRYTNENGWYECDKIRFRQGTPEKIGGWVRLTNATFLGTCRSLFNWVTLDSQNLLSLGTNLKFYIERGGAYFDITPIRFTTTLGTDPFTGNGTTTVTVTSPGHGATTNDFVTFSGATGPSAALLNGERQITEVVDANTYKFVTTAVVPAGATGGAAVTAAYQINTGLPYEQPANGWGAGAWSSGSWGDDPANIPLSLSLWSQGNFGEDLIFGPRGGTIYIWDATNGVTTRGVGLSTLPDASDVPVVQNFILVSNIQRFIFAMGCNDYGSLVQDPLLIRWCNQEDAAMWTPSPTNQAGSLRLSNGSEIVAAVQTRQEVVVFTDSAVHSLQYLGVPAVWGSQVLADNTSIVGQNAAAVASGVVYWMGVDKFYAYDGRVQTLNCDLLRHIFTDFNHAQAQQVFAGTNEGFNEVWWFYPSNGSLLNNKYVVYNYVEKVWYYGNLSRTAWLDSGLRAYPIAATGLNNIVYHENGVDDNETGTTQPIVAYISSAEFDLDDGQNFGFVWRMVPDVTFTGSQAQNPSLTMTLTPLKGSGAGYNVPQSVAGSSSAAVTRSEVVPIEKFTNIVYIRVRGRQMVIRAQSDGIGVAWQLGSPRIDVRPDGRR